MVNMNQQMNKTAAIMARVSSDEQARGYSLGVQEEALKRYCERNGISVVYEFKEDHSAKNFNRPAFTQFLKHLKTQKGKVDYLLFTTWDRFSRNQLDALNMIQKLRSYGTQPMAIEQPLDLTIPENKAMLAIFLTLPEIDNDRRSIKIKGGVRAALKAGKWPRMAPIGYKNSRDTDNKPILVSSDNGKDIVWAFRQVAKGVPQAAILVQLKGKGVKISRNNLSLLLRNPVYAGLIKVPAQGTEPETIVKGKHEALIDETLFLLVQNVLNGNNLKRNKPKVNKQREELPLRGKMICSKCGERMTGSASRSKTGKKHFYYHCNRCHKERFRAQIVNDSVEEILGLINPNVSIEQMYRSIVEAKIEGISRMPKVKVKEAQEKLQELSKRLVVIQDRLTDGTITIDEYKDIKARYLLEKAKWEEKAKESGIGEQELKGKLKKVLEAIKQLQTLYREASVSDKQRIVSSILGEQIIFDGKNCRTPELNEAVSLIISVDKTSGKNKTGQKIENSPLSRLVARTGVEPVTSGL